MKKIIPLINQLIPHLTTSELKIAKYIIGNPEEIVNIDISVLSNKAGSSNAAVIRFCHRLELSGFKELKVLLAKEVYSGFLIIDEDKNLSPNDAVTISELKESMLSAVRETLESLDSIISSQTISKAVEYILESQYVLLAGTGASGIVASDLSLKLMRIGIKTSHSIDEDAQIIQACNLSENDTVIVCSYSGETKTAIKVANKAKERGSTVISISKIGGNSLSKIADINLAVPNCESLYRQGATLSRINQMVVVDILFSALLLKDRNAVEKARQTWNAISH
jgi:DNA-binding MurR/RpiR family transcriptional regulator